MKKLLFVMPLFALAACEGSIASAVGNAGSGSFSDGQTISTSSSDPGEFQGVTLAGPDNVVFTTDDSYSIRAEGDADAIERLRYKISDGQLKIGREKKRGLSWGDSGSVTVYVSAPALRSAKLAGAGDMKVDKISGDDTTLSLAGSGNLAVAEFDAASVKTKIAGSGDVKLAGSADTITVSIAGSGDVKGKDFKADNATIKIAGSGNVALSSDGEVDARVSGSGDIRIHGDAACTSKVSGSGKIDCG